MMSVMKHDIKPYSKSESIIVGLVLAGILIPLRFLTLFALGDSWIGTLGVISFVTLIMIILSHKQKIGKFGDMFLRQITKMHKGKRKWFIYTQTVIFFTFALTSLYAINEGNTTYLDMKLQVAEQMKALGIDDYDSLVDRYKETPTEQQAQAIAQMPSLFFKQFGIIAVTAAITDDLMHNWYSHMLIFILVETTEVAILLVITKKYSYKT